MSATKFLDKKIVQTIDNILESNYEAFAQEKERKQERQKQMAQSEETILRKMPVTKRLRYLNMKADPKLQHEFEPHWADEKELIQYRDKTPKMPMNIDTDNIISKIQPQKVTVTDISYDKNDNVCTSQKERLL